MSDRAVGAGVLVAGIDGGALAFTELDDVAGAATSRTHELLRDVAESASAAVWDPVIGGWRVVFSARVPILSDTAHAGPLLLATITPAGGLQVTPVGCSIFADELEATLVGRALFVAHASYSPANPESGVLRVDL